MRRRLRRTVAGRGAGPHQAAKKWAQGLTEAAGERNAFGAKRIQRICKRSYRAGCFADNFARAHISGSGDVQDLGCEGAVVAGPRVRCPAAHPQWIAIEMAPERLRQAAHRLEAINRTQRRAQRRLAKACS
ncbi:hypothetical protein ACVWYH_010255 [Bradyrhizobium sp. GM24.11]